MDTSNLARQLDIAVAAFAPADARIEAFCARSDQLIATGECSRTQAARKAGAL